MEEPAKCPHTVEWALLWRDWAATQAWSFTGNSRRYIRRIYSITEYKRFLSYIQKQFSIRIIFWAGGGAGRGVSPWNISETQMHWVCQKHYLKIQRLKVLTWKSWWKAQNTVSCPHNGIFKKSIDFADSRSLASCSFQEHCHGCQLTQLLTSFPWLTEQQRCLMYFLVTFIVFVGNISKQGMHLKIIEHAEYVQTKF